MNRSRPRLSAEAFARASARARAMHVEVGTIALARAVLVDGRRQVDVATEAEKTTAWVSEAVGKLMRYADDVERSTVPPGWKTGTVALPAELWPQVRQLEREARARLKDKSGV